jgi:putative transposase
MHKMLTGKAIRPPRPTLAAQQRAFHHFRHLYNHKRPHQPCRARRPRCSTAPPPGLYTTDSPPIEYPGHFIVKRGTNAATIRFKKRLLFIPNAL